MDAFFVKKKSCLHTFYEKETNNKCVLCLGKCVQGHEYSCYSMQKVEKKLSEKENTLLSITSYKKTL